MTPDIERLQLLEQSIQNLLMQKQMFQLELAETENALNELNNVKKSEDVFKMVGSLMFKSDKETLTKDLTKKQDLLNLRMKAIEKQEDDLKKRLLETRKKIVGN
ncbi:MAG: prefoldin subunit beta [archaeon]